ncbi:phosphatase 2C-like domain-containing protein [Linnemannia elongata]|nr:phosphatase 2C-like domain-containing protein [Linnemannia elongata]
MHRYITAAPQLLLTNTTTTSSSSSLDSVLPALAVAPGTTSVAGIHTSAVSLQQHQQQSQVHNQVLQQDQQAPLSDKQAPIDATTGTSTSSTASVTSATSSAAASSPSTVQTPGSQIAFNYLLAASWHPKSRHRKASSALSASGSSSSSASSSEDENDESKTKWWKQKLRAGKVDAGEDAFFHVSTPSRVALGVADGVGGWSEVGVDPALFSWALMDNAEAVAHRSTSKIPLDAQSILDGAYSELVQSGKVEAGSSTACILSLCKVTGTLRASNLGDSAYLLIRDNKCIYESPSQQHFWNCPYQLTVLPPGYPGAKQHVMDMPKDAAQTTHQLQDGDVIVLATDGFWDNVFTKEAIELVDRELGDVIQQTKGGLAQGASVEDVVGRVRALSQRLTNTARRFSLDQKRRTPFSQSARHIRSGGKVDDITVIVTLVRALANNEHS